jgi:arginine exporter protein ArgO
VFVVSALTCALLSAIGGWQSTSDRLHHLDWSFLPVVLGAHVVAYVGYFVAHHQVLNRRTPRHVSWKASAQVLIIGFGAWLIGGGFEVDRRALRNAGLADDDASSSAIVLSALELAVLAPAAWICAVRLLGTAGVSHTVTIPWAFGVPIGFALTLAAAWNPRVRRAAAKPGRWRWLGLALNVLASMRALLRDPRRGPLVIAGVAMYWAADITALWASLRLVSTPLELQRLIVGYAAGYVLTRRTLPFAGALITEALIALSLCWVGVPLAAAALAVLVYRLSDFALTFGAALCAGSAVERTLTFLSPGVDQ